MKIRMQNIGPLKDATIEMGKLTVLTGTNNTGKTYAMYMMWGAVEKSFAFDLEYKELKFISKYADRFLKKKSIEINVFDVFKENRQEFINYFNKNLNNSLNSLFNSNDFLSKKSIVSIDFDNKLMENYIYESKNNYFPFIRSILDCDYEEGIAIIKIISFEDYFIEYEDFFKDKEQLLPKQKQKDVALVSYNKIVSDYDHNDAIETIGSILIYIIRSAIFDIYGNPFLRTSSFIPASRTGLNLTYQEVTEYKSNLMQEMRRPVSRIDPKILKEKPVSAYSEPVESYLQLLADGRRIISNRMETIFNDFLQEKISKVKYSVDEWGNVFGTPLNSNQAIPLYLLSSTSNSLYGLWLWLQLYHYEKSGSLMIDEPELNLHPENQILLARLLVRLVNSGVHVAISTHSDYIVREISNMMMLHQDFPDRAKFAEAYDYDLDKETIAPSDVKAFHFTTEGDHAVVTPCRILDPGGIEVPSMDNTIDKQNNCYDALFDSILDQKSASKKPKKKK